MRRESRIERWRRLRPVKQQDSTSSRQCSKAVTVSVRSWDCQSRAVCPPDDAPGSSCSSARMHSSSPTVPRSFSISSVDSYALGESRRDLEEVARLDFHRVDTISCIKSSHIFCLQHPFIVRDPLVRAQTMFPLLKASRPTYLMTSDALSLNLG